MSSTPINGRLSSPLPKEVLITDTIHRNKAWHRKYGIKRNYQTSGEQYIELMKSLTQAKYACTMPHNGTGELQIHAKTTQQRAGKQKGVPRETPLASGVGMR